MSLEGLDSAQLSEAFESAQAEPGGWFWIKYVTRDEVELLKKGGNGTEEMRVAAMAEPEDSPLYGFIKFRRRNVLVKYVPEGTSRVLKARSQVHFQLVAERLSPHDTIVTIEYPKELTDAALNSVCSTHAATASISSSNSSIRQRRLTDIAESADEGDEAAGTTLPGTVVKQYALGNIGGGSKETTTGAVALAVVVTSHDSAVSDEEGSGAPAMKDRDPTAVASLLSKGDFSSTTNLSITSTSNSSTSEPRRKSTSSATRPSAADIYSYYPYVPKVKLGPRPVPHVEAPKRSHTSNDRSKNSASLPVPDELRASVPRSVHLSPRKTSASKTPTPSIHSIPEPTLPPSPTTPAASLYSFSIHSSSASLKTAGTAEGPTPEKQRLMKALQLRRQQQQQKEQKLQDKVDENDSPPTDESTTSGEQIPTITMTTLESTEPVTAAPILDTDASLDKTNAEIYPTKNADNSADAVSEVTIDSSDKVEGREESTMSGNDEAVMEKSTDEAKKEDKREKDSIATPETKPEPEAETAEISLADTEGDKLLEGTTKVRDNIDEESDGESAVSLHNESRPTTTTVGSKPTTTQQSAQAPATTDATLMPPPKSNPKRSVSSTVAPLNESPVLETARSVSAPFLKGARPELKPAAAKKAPVGGGGSVSQRIRQFQQLAGTQKKPAQNFSIPPRTPSRGSIRSNSPTPEFLANRPQSAMSNKSPTRAGSISGLSGAAAALAPAAVPLSYRNSMPPPPLHKEPIRANVVIVDREPMRPQLQVSTRIPTDEHSMMSPSISPKSAKPSLNVLSPVESNVPMDGPVALPFFNVAPTGDTPPTPTLRRTSMDIGSSVRNSSRDREGRPRMFSRSPKDKDLEDVPESTATAASSGTHTRRGSASSTKSPKSPSFLKRVSESLTRKKDPSPPPPPPPPPEPVESPNKKYLHVGSINVQLPDTMLWKRRYMKIDPEGWLFLSLTDDENAPQTRRFHIPTEVGNIDVPDMDEQELPYSVRLMLREGGMLQCACQNSAEQKQVLGVIRKCAS